MSQLNPSRARQLRGEILSMLCDRHNDQGHRLDDVQVTRILQGMANNVSIYHVITLLQDLKDRGYVRFAERRDDLSLRICLQKIELTAKGRDQVEENVETDPAIEF